MSEETVNQCLRLFGIDPHEYDYEGEDDKRELYYSRLGRYLQNLIEFKQAHKDTFAEHQYDFHKFVRNCHEWFGLTDYEQLSFHPEYILDQAEFPALESLRTAFVATHNKVWARK